MKIDPEKLRSLREARGYNKTSLAKHSGLTRRTLINLEGGHTLRPTQGTVKCLCAALGCRIAELEAEIVTLKAQRGAL